MRTEKISYWKICDDDNDELPREYGELLRELGLEGEVVFPREEETVAFAEEVLRRVAVNYYTSYEYYSLPGCGDEAFNKVLSELSSLTGKTNFSVTGVTWEGTISTEEGKTSLDVYGGFTKVFRAFPRKIRGIFRQKRTETRVIDGEEFSRTVEDKWETSWVEAHPLSLHLYVKRVDLTQILPEDQPKDKP